MHSCGYDSDLNLILQGSSGGGRAFAGAPGDIPDYYREGSGKSRKSRDDGLAEIAAMRFHTSKEWRS